jgi:hypothetical protein
MHRVVASNFVVRDAFVLRLVRISKKLINRQIVAQRFWFIALTSAFSVLALVFVLLATFLLLFLFRASGQSFLLGLLFG